MFILLAFPWLNEAEFQLWISEFSPQWTQISLSSRTILPDSGHRPSAGSFTSRSPIWMPLSFWVPNNITILIKFRVHFMKNQTHGSMTNKSIHELTKKKKKKIVDCLTSLKHMGQNAPLYYWFHMVLKKHFQQKLQVVTCCSVSCFVIFKKKAIHFSVTRGQTWVYMSGNISLLVRLIKCVLCVQVYICTFFFKAT